MKISHSLLTKLPDNVVNAYDILFLGIFRVTYNSRAGLQPRVAPALVHQSIVMRQHLTFVDN